MNAVVSVVSVSAVCDQVDQGDQVVPAHQVDDIDEVHELDPVHQVDHKNERCDYIGRFWVDIGRFWVDIVRFQVDIGHLPPSPGWTLADTRCPEPVAEANRVRGDLLCGWLAEGRGCLVAWLLGWLAFSGPS